MLHDYHKLKSLRLVQSRSYILTETSTGDHILITTTRQPMNRACFIINVHLILRFFHSPITSVNFVIVVCDDTTPPLPPFNWRSHLDHHDISTDVHNIHLVLRLLITSVDSVTAVVESPNRNADATTHSCGFHQKSTEEFYRSEGCD